jgi:pimeloyl-ACP methyl ester carboxylesterase
VITFSDFGAIAAEGTKTQLGDVQLQVCELGEGPPLLFLHGEDGLAFSGPLIERLAVDFHVYAPSHPGWGDSTRPAYLTETRDLGLVYAELVEELGAAPTVVGCSFGAWVAAELGVLTRAPLAAQVLVAPTGVKMGSREDRDFADIWMADFAELPTIFYGDPSQAPDLTDLAEDQYLYLARAQEATARFCWKPYMHDPKLGPWLRRIAAPSLVVAGAADRFALLDGYYDHYASLIGSSGAELQILPGIGHRVEEEAAVELADLIVDFSKRSTTGPVAASSGRN